MESDRIRLVFSVESLSHRLRLHGRINLGAVGCSTGTGGSVPVGMERFETGKVQAIWSPVFFLYFSGLVRNLISMHAAVVVSARLSPPTRRFTPVRLPQSKVLGFRY